MPSSIQFRLHCVKGAVDLLAESDAVELTQYGFLEALADTFGLGVASQSRPLQGTDATTLTTSMFGQKSVGESPLSSAETPAVRTNCMA